MLDKLKIIGLTGSIGMGKTTTANMFKDLGCPVFDADAAVHALYARGGRAVALIKAVFPDAIKNGAVDRAVLGGHMRADPLNLKVLESFIHPWVGQMRAEFLEHCKRDKVKAAVFDIPLLYETGAESQVDAVVVVSAPALIQKARVLARPGITPQIFEMLLARQMPDAEKRQRADYIISTGEGLAYAREQVQATLIDILKL